MRRLSVVLGMVWVLTCFGVAEQSPVDTSVSWLRSAWKSVQDQGKPAAERVIREFPDRFKAIPKQVNTLTKSTQKGIAGMKLDEKRALVSELWRIRGCINLMSLIDSGMLEQITGIDTKTLKNMSAQLSKMQNLLTIKK